MAKKYIGVFFILLISVIGCDGFNNDDPEVEPAARIYVVKDPSDALIGEAFVLDIQEAFSRVLPGGEIIVMPGVYSVSIELGQIYFQDQPITVRAEDEDIVVFDGEKELPFAIWCQRCSGIIFKDITIQNYTDFGIGVADSQNILFTNLTVGMNGFDVQLMGWELEGYGILVNNSEGIVVENSKIYGNGPDPRPFGMMGTGVNYFECNDCAVTANEIYDTVGGGILVEDSERVLVSGNYVHDNYLDATEAEWWDGGLWIDGGQDITVTDNVFENNIGPGIEISDEDYQYPTGYLIENNIFRGNLFAIYIWNFDIDVTAEKIQLKYNIFEDNQQDIVNLGWLD